MYSIKSKVGGIGMSECEACGHKKTDGYYNSNDITNTMRCDCECHQEEATWHN